MEAAPEKAEENGSSDEDDDSEDDDDGTQVEEEIRNIKLKLLDKPFDYDTHLQLISFARSHGELQEIRSARQEMSKKFPLTPSLWLDWITDEKALLEGDQLTQRQAITELFERAVKDYASVDLWLEYAQFSMADMTTPEGVDRVRDVVNRGLVQVGLDAAKGSLLWDFLREFEKILINLCPDQESRKAHVSKLTDAFRRQLSIPLINMKSTFQEFEEFCKEFGDLLNPADIETVKRGYESALKVLEQITPFEDSLLSSNPPDAHHFKDYAEFVQKAKMNPATVQSVFERGVTEHPLDPDLWTRYLKFLDNSVKIKQLSRDVYERAVKNCPWSGFLWSNFIESMEGFDDPLSDIIAVFERSLSAGLATSAEFKLIWTTFLDCQRRRTNFDSVEEVERLRKTFNSACEHLAAIPDADPTFSVLQYSARVEAVFCRSMDNAREIWNNMMQMKELSRQASLWMEFFHLEYAYGDRKEARKILNRAFTSSLDWPEAIGELLVRMEREEGDSLQMYQKTIWKYSQVMEKVAEKRLKDEEKKPQARSNVVQPKTTQREPRKRKLDQPTQLEDERAFKKPLLPEATKRGNVTKSVESDQLPSTSKAAAAQVPHFVKPKDKTETDDLLTVFISNLDFGVDEDKLRFVFCEFGDITDIRLVRNYKGLSKGYAYVQYSSMEGVHKALAHDRLKIEGRPAFISEVGKKKEFKYKDGREKEKLFVNGLAPDVDEQVLRQVFEKYGQLRDIRIVTYRNGHSKGCAYIEYTDEVGARAGLAADGLLLNGMNIKVAISDPSARKKEPGRQPASLAVLGSGASGPGSFSSRGQTGRQRISLPFVPTAVRRQQQIPQDRTKVGNGSV